MAPSHITLTLFLFIVAVCASEDIKVTRNTFTGFRPTKLFVFGDSYSDTGNNPKSLASSWKTPYGFTFPGKPAGRYSDGRVLTDYVARFMGIKSPLPYRVTKYAPSKLRAGINFAFGGTGVFDTGNFQPNLTTQIGYLQGLIKDSVYTKRDLKSSLAMVTVSGNDYSAFTASGGSQQFDTPLKPVVRPQHTLLAVEVLMENWKANCIRRDSTDGMTDLDDMDDIEMIMQQLQSEQEQQQAAERVHRRNYIYRERFDAEEHLMAD
ncbi:GDSL esterase/lipase-like protein [Tanacetum coccineum]